MPLKIMFVGNIWARLMAQAVKNLPTSRRYRRHGFDLWDRKMPWRRKWLTTPVFFPGKSHGLRSLVVYSPWGHKGSDTHKGTYNDIGKCLNNNWNEQTQTHLQYDPILILLIYSLLHVHTSPQKVIFINSCHQMAECLNFCFIFYIHIHKLYFLNGL